MQFLLETRCTASGAQKQSGSLNVLVRLQKFLGLSLDCLSDRHEQQEPMRNVQWQRSKLVFERTKLKKTNRLF